MFKECKLRLGNFDKDDHTGSCKPCHKAKMCDLLILLGVSLVAAFDAKLINILEASVNEGCQQLLE